MPERKRQKIKKRKAARGFLWALFSLSDNGHTLEDCMSEIALAGKFVVSSASWVESIAKSHVLSIVANKSLPFDAVFLKPWQLAADITY
jgi:hypothetical protein